MLSVGDSYSIQKVKLPLACKSSSSCAEPLKSRINSSLVYIYANEHFQGHFECILRLITEAINVTVKVLFRYDVFMRFAHSVWFNAVQCLTITISKTLSISSTRDISTLTNRNLLSKSFSIRGWTERIWRMAVSERIRNIEEKFVRRNGNIGEEVITEIVFISNISDTARRLSSLCSSSEMKFHWNPIWGVSNELHHVRRLWYFLITSLQGFLHGVAKKLRSCEIKLWPSTSTTTSQLLPLKFLG